MNWFSWRTVLMSYGVAAMAAGLSCIGLKNAGDFCGEPPSVSSLLSLLTDKGIWVMILLFSLSIGVNQGVFAMTPLYLTAERGLDLNLAIRLTYISRFFAFGVPLLTGWIADRWGLKRTLIVVTAACGPAVFFMALAPNDPLWIGLGLFAQAATSVCFFPLGFAALATIVEPKYRSMAVAVTIPFSNLIGAGLVPYLIGAAGDGIGFKYGLIGLGALTLIGLSLFRFLKLK